MDTIFNYALLATPGSQNTTRSFRSNEAQHQEGNLSSHRPNLLIRVWQSIIAPILDVSACVIQELRLHQGPPQHPYYLEPHAV